MKRRTIIKAILLFFIPLILAGYMESTDKELEEGIYIKRNAAGEGEKDICLELSAEGIPKDYEYKLEIAERLFTEEEAFALMEEAISEIDRDVKEKKDKVPLKKMYQSGLVEATWKLDCDGYIDMEGNIQKEEIPQEGLIVNAEVGLECQNYESIYHFSFWIPRQEATEAEHLLSEIARYVDEELKKEGESRVTLPTEINGTSLVWNETKGNLVIKMFFLEIAVVVLFVLSGIEKRKREEKERLESMERDYPEIVGQMGILLGAGMTISQAWDKIAVQYEEKRQKDIIKPRPAFEEFVEVNRRMKEGEGERQALLFMESKIPLLSYRRLIRILLNTKSKGGNNWQQELKQETERAYAQRVYVIKQKGEEASTKMLIPLMLMMIIVIAIVISPALIELAG